MSMYAWFGFMLAVSFVWVVWYLRYPLKSNNLNLTSSNIELGKQKIAELESDLEQGLIDQDQFVQAKEEISNTLAFELEQEHTAIDNKAGISPTAWLFILLLLPVSSIYTYQQLTNFLPTVNTEKDSVKPLSLEQSIVKLTQYVEDNADDAEAWKTLGLMYYESGQLNDAVSAYQKSYQINPNDPQLLTQYASAVISANNEQFTSKSVELIKHALELNPNNPDALYLAGLFAVEARDLDLAKSLWNRALSAVPKDGLDHQILTDIVADLTGVIDQENNRSITINVSISPQVTESRSSKDYIMVYVKAAQGRPMPIAIKKIRLKDFTGQVVLSDADSVIPENKLSSHSRVVAVARISETGSAMRQPGDMHVTSDAFDLKEEVSIDLKID